MLVLCSKPFLDSHLTESKSQYLHCGPPGLCDQAPTHSPQPISLNSSLPCSPYSRHTYKEFCLRALESVLLSAWNAFPLDIYTAPSLVRSLLKCHFLSKAVQDLDLSSPPSYSMFSAALTVISFTTYFAYVMYLSSISCIRKYAPFGQDILFTAVSPAFGKVPSRQ